MTTENKSIWHTSDENIQPNSQIVCFDKGGGKAVAIVDDVGQIHSVYSCIPHEWIDKFAYIDDLVSTSKALEVAVIGLQSILDPIITNQNWWSWEARKSLSEIDKIMKGDK